MSLASALACKRVAIPSMNRALRPSKTIFFPAQLQFRAASGGAPKYNEPSGYLFGETPPPPGQKRKKEDWELIYYWGIGGGMVLAGLMKYYKSGDSLESWSRKEATRRMEENGTMPTYDKGAL